MNLKGKEVLVTGGHGFLGRYVCDRLRAAGAKVSAYRRAQYNLEDPADVQRLFSRVRPHIVVHLAAEVGGIAANKANPGRFFYANMLMGLNVVEAARAFGVEKLVLVGSTCAYPRLTISPFREENLWLGYPEETNAAYGLAKRELLTLAQGYREQYGLNAVYLIPTNLYGPGGDFDLQSGHSLHSIIRRIVDATESAASSVTLWGSGKPTRDYLYVDDCAEAIVKAVASYDGSLAVNLGSGDEISIEALARLIASEVGFTGTVHWDKSKPDGQPRRCMDLSRAVRFLDWVPKTTLRNGLRRTIEAYLRDRAMAVKA